MSDLNITHRITPLGLTGVVTYFQELVMFVLLSSHLKTSDILSTSSSKMAQRCVAPPCGNMKDTENGITLPVTRSLGVSLSLLPNVVYLLVLFDNLKAILRQLEARPHTAR